MPREAKHNQCCSYCACKRKHYYKNDKAGKDVRDDKEVMEIKDDGVKEENSGDKKDNDEREK
eukprot:2639174-Ditylum_brightwellii.AAC.1